MQSAPTAKERLEANIEKKRRLSVIGELHLEIERELEEFDTIIPFKHNTQVANEIYSPRLYYLLQGTCSCVDSAMKLLCENLDVLPKKKNMLCYLAALNNHDMLTVQRVIHRKTMTEFQPFMIPAGMQAPLWWTAYNDTKHDLLNGGVTKATFGNTLEATAALFSLLHLLSHTLVRPPAHMLDGKKWRDFSAQIKRDYSRLEFLPPTTGLLQESDKPYLESKQKVFKSQIFYYAMLN